MNLILQDVLYVISDPFFLPSMAFTTMLGIFIGAVIYDGNFKQVKRMLLSLFCYASLIVTVTLTRVIPRVSAGILTIHPYAQIITIIGVTIFYLLGVFIGVKIIIATHRRKVVL